MAEAQESLCPESRYDAVWTCILHGQGRHTAKSQQLTICEGVSVRRPACLQGLSGMALPALGPELQVASMQRMPLQDSDTAQGGRMAAGASAGQDADLDPLDPRFLARIHDPHQR